MKLILFIFTILIISSCKNQSEDSDMNYNNAKSQKHKNLIEFRSKFVMGMDKIFDKPEKEYQQLIDDINFYSETDTILYLEDTLYISYLTYVNACAEYEGDIKFKPDSLFLKAKNIRNEECASGNIERFIYKIYNPENMKYKIVKY